MKEELKPESQTVDDLALEVAFLANDTFDEKKEAAINVYNYRERILPNDYGASPNISNSEKHFYWETNAAEDAKCQSAHKRFYLLCEIASKIMQLPSSSFKE